MSNVGTLHDISTNAVLNTITCYEDGASYGVTLDYIYDRIHKDITNRITFNWKIHHRIVEILNMLIETGRVVKVDSDLDYRFLRKRYKKKWGRS